MRLALLSFVLAMMLGFATNLASIRTVRAVAKMINTGNSHVLRSIANSVLWVSAITIPIESLCPE